MTARDKLFVLLAVVLLTGWIVTTVSRDAQAAGEGGGQYQMAAAYSAVVVLDTSSGEVWTYKCEEVTPDDEWVSLGKPGG